MLPIPPARKIPLGAWAGSAAFIIGGGPSLAALDLEQIRGRGRVIAVNNAGLDLAPWADILYFADGWSRWFGWNADRLDRFRGGQILTRAKLRPWPDPADPRLARVEWIQHAAHIEDGSGVAGICGGANAISLAWQLGASPIILLGFDMRPGNYHGAHKLPPKIGQHRLTFIPGLERMACAMRGARQFVINATTGSALRAFPSVPLEELLAMDNLATLEREKYARIWERDEYRRISPGMFETERALLVCGMQPGQSLTDFGCGTGRASAWFEARGLDVLAVDFAPTALEHEVAFVDACLWSMGAAVPVRDYAFCADVLEHIPPARVGQVIAAIAARTRRAAYFRIATRPDKCGRLIGQKLHLTIQPGAWWRNEISGHFASVDLLECDGRDVVLVARGAGDD